MEKLCVLFVDDEPKILRSLKAAYKFDFDVLTAEGVKQAKNLIVMKKDAIDVVITDERMPDLSGSDFIQWLKKFSPYTASIMLTGAPNLNQLKERLAKTPPFAFVSKPWITEELSDAIVKANKQAKAALVTVQRKQKAKIIAYNSDAALRNNCENLSRNLGYPHLSIFVDTEEKIFDYLKKMHQPRLIIINGVENETELKRLIVRLRSAQSNLAIVVMATPSFARFLLKQELKTQIDEIFVTPISSIRFLPVMNKILREKDNIANSTK